MKNVKPTAYIQDGVFVFNGRFNLPLAAALAHVDHAQFLFNTNNNTAALKEAILAEALDPGAIEPELILGDTEAAAGNKPAARAAYNRAIPTIQTMEPDARNQWLSTVHQKLAAL